MSPKEPQKEYEHPWIDDFILGCRAADSLDSLKALEKRQAEDPENMLLFHILINAYFDCGKKTQAKKTLDRAKKHLLRKQSKTNVKQGYLASFGTDNIFDHLKIHDVATGYEKLEEYKTAKSIYKEGMNRCSKDIPRYNALCAQLVRLEFEYGSQKKVISLLEDKYLKHDIGNTLIYWILALAYLYEGKTDDARAAFLFGCRRGLQDVFTRTIGDERESVEHKVLVGERIISGTKELINLMGPKDQRPLVLLACCDFAHGNYKDAAARLAQVISINKAILTGEDYNQSKEMYYWACARTCLSNQEASQARKYYLKATATSLDKGRQKSFRVIAGVIELDKRIESLFQGSMRPRSLRELSDRLVIVRKQLDSLLGLHKTTECVSRLPIALRTDEQLWGIIKSNCLLSLHEVIQFKESIETRERWTRAQRELTRAGMTVVCKAVGCMESFALTFGQIVAQRRYSNLDTFTDDEQKSLLNLLSPASAIDGVFTAQATEPRFSIKKILEEVQAMKKQIETIHPIQVIGNVGAMVSEGTAHVTMYPDGKSHVVDGKDPEAKPSQATKETEQPQEMDKKNRIEFMKEDSSEPFDFTCVLQKARRISEKEKYTAINQSPLKGYCKRTVEYFDRILQAANSNSDVLIIGETGTGKEPTAEQIHKNSFRSSNVYLHKNLGGATLNRGIALDLEIFGGLDTNSNLKKGALELATVYNDKGIPILEKSGTVFLDECADLDPSVQVKLLCALSSRKMDLTGVPEPKRFGARIIFATQEQPEKLVDQGRWRPDFYYRLTRRIVKIPPLRERKEDIPLIVYSFIKRANTCVKGITDNAMKLLLKRYWGGNIRYLENTIDRLCEDIKVPFINASDLSQAFLDYPDPLEMQNKNEPHKYSTDQIDKAKLAADAIKSCHGDLNRAAEYLGVSLATLYRWRGLARDQNIL